MAVRINRIGQKHGRLLVVAKTDRPASGYQTIWECLCDCGKTAYVRGGNLQSGHTVSCGCRQGEIGKESRQDLTGKQFGPLTAIKDTPRRTYGSIVWICMCQCGKEARISASDLRYIKSDIACWHEWRASLPIKDGRSFDSRYLNYKCRKRQLEKMLRTPPWADQHHIQVLYTHCPKGYQLDHVYPLQGKLISGLHVPSNLAYIPADENKRKGRKFTPHLIYPNGSIEEIT